MTLLKSRQGNREELLSSYWGSERTSYNRKSISVSELV